MARPMHLDCCGRRSRKRDSRRPSKRPGSCARCRHRCPACRWLPAHCPCCATVCPCPAKTTRLTVRRCRASTTWAIIRRYRPGAQAVAPRHADRRNRRRSQPVEMVTRRQQHAFPDQLVVSQFDQQAGAVPPSCFERTGPARPVRRRVGQALRRVRRKSAAAGGALPSAPLPGSRRAARGRWVILAPVAKELQRRRRCA